MTNSTSPSRTEKIRTIKSAADIAKRDLRSCYGIHGIYAGLNQFHDYWARDSFFASLGSSELKDYDIVKRNLIHFMDNHKHRWYLPKVILRSQLHKILFFTTKKAIRLRSIGLLATFRAMDQQSLFIISAARYIQTSNDIYFLKQNINNFERIIQHDLAHDSDRNFLIEQIFYNDWEDSLRKKGEILYTNVCRCYALESMAKLCTRIGETKLARIHSNAHIKTKNMVIKKFWKGSFFCDNAKGDNTFNGAGNALAMLFNIADKEKAIKIHKYVKDNNLFDFTLKANHPNYSWQMVSPWNFLIGLADYHTEIRWLWIGAMYSAGLYTQGLKKESLDCLYQVAKKILEFAHVYEVYEPEGKPVSRPLYKSEVPFAWSSGLYIYAAALQGIKL